MRRITLIIAILMGLCNVLAKTNQIPDYEISGNGTGTQGTYLVNVSVLSKKKNISEAELARCAVHGVLFRGFSNKDLRQSQKPLAGGPAVETSHPDFFNSFFAEEGPFKGYVSEVSGSRQVVKSGKQYKVTATVTVNKEQLRQDLEKAGIIKGLNSIF